MFLMHSDKNLSPKVNICSRNSQNKTTSHLIICHNYATQMMKGYQWSTYVTEKERSFKHETY